MYLLANLVKRSKRISLFLIFHQLPVTFYLLQPCSFNAYARYLFSSTGKEIFDVIVGEFIVTLCNLLFL